MRRVGVRHGRAVNAPEGEDAPAPVRLGNRALEVMEAAVYVVIAALLFVLALSLLWYAVLNVPALFTSDNDELVALEVLDTLLLVFIVVELLYAVRMTLAHRELVAEPFLLVGIIASIKEIVVLSVKAADLIGKGRPFTDAAVEIGLLGLLIFLLGLTAWLLRMKEQHPEEAGDEAEPKSRT